MNTQHSGLLKLRVADIMEEHVVTLSAHATMEEAARVLCDHGISGAPVVDEMGRCIGVLSARDFTRRDQQDDSSELLPHRECEFIVEHDEFRGPMQIHYVPEDVVERYMTPAPQTVDAEQTLLEAARYMTGSHVSRLVVVDEDSRPVGIVGALDLLGAWVRDADREV